MRHNPRGVGEASAVAKRAICGDVILASSSPGSLIVQADSSTLVGCDVSWMQVGPPGLSGVGQCAGDDGGTNGRLPDVRAFVSSAGPAMRRRCLRLRRNTVLRSMPCPPYMAPPYGASASSVAGISAALRRTCDAASCFAAAGDSSRAGGIAACCIASSYTAGRFETGDGPCPAAASWSGELELTCC